MPDPTPIPPPIARPPLALWLWRRGLSLRDGAAYFDTTAETLRRACLPFDHPCHRPPYRALLRRIMALTGGEIRLDDWFPELASAERAAA